MHKIYSLIDNHIICCYINKEEISDYRKDLSEESEIIQGSARILSQNIHVPAHKHLPIKRETVGTQEVWVIILGKILAEIYDIDDKKLTDIEISSGGAILFYRGGHSLTSLENNTIFYEFKNGPYNGKENDKQHIN